MLVFFLKRMILGASVFLAGALIMALYFGDAKPGTVYAAGWMAAIVADMVHTLFGVDKKP